MLIALALLAVAWLALGTLVALFVSHAAKLGD